MKNISITLAVIFLLTALLIGCDRIQEGVLLETDVAPVSTDSVKIGFLASGSRVTYPNGAEIAISEINESGGLLGRSVELVTEIGIPTPEAAVEAASRMILADSVADSVIALVGPNRSSEAIVTGALAGEYRLPLIATTATNPAVTRSSDFVFMAAFTDIYQGAVMARFAVEDLGLTSVALLIQSDEVYSEGISKSFETHFTGAGGTIAAREFYEVWDNRLYGAVESYRRGNP